MDRNVSKMVNSSYDQLGEGPRRRRGRPRSEASRAAILSAALFLVGEMGYGKVTLERIASHARVGKQTIYRWWDSRASLMSEVVRELALEKVQDRDLGSLRSDLEHFIGAGFDFPLDVPQVPALLQGLMAEAQFDPDFHKRLLGELLEPRRAALRAVLERARSRGDLRRTIDIELVIDIVHGVLWYNLLATRRPLTRRVARNLAEVIARAST